MRNFLQICLPRFRWMCQLSCKVDACVLNTTATLSSTTTWRSFKLDKWRWFILTKIESRLRCMYLTPVILIEFPNCRILDEFGVLGEYFESEIDEWGKKVFEFLYFGLGGSVVYNECVKLERWFFISRAMTRSVDFPRDFNYHSYWYLWQLSLVGLRGQLLGFGSTWLNQGIVEVRKKKLYTTSRKSRADTEVGSMLNGCPSLSTDFVVFLLLNKSCDLKKNSKFSCQDFKNYLKCGEITFRKKILDLNRCLWTCAWILTYSDKKFMWIIFIDVYLEYVNLFRLFFLN